MKFATILTNAQTDGQIVSAYLFRQYNKKNKTTTALRFDTTSSCRLSGSAF